MGLFTHQSCDNKDKSSPMAGLAGSVLEVSNNAFIIDRHNNQVLIMSDQVSRKHFIIWKSTTDTREKGRVIWLFQEGLAHIEVCRNKITISFWKLNTRADWQTNTIKCEFSWIKSENVTILNNF